MLDKLIEYEFKSTARWFLPLYIFTLVMAPLTRLFISIPIFKNKFLRPIPNIFEALYVLSIVVIIVATMLLIVLRFYKSMSTEEGYLTHTLPVSSTTLIISKLIASFLWSVLAIMVSILSSILLFIEPSDFQEIINAFSSREMAMVLKEFDKYNISLTLLIIGGIGGILFGICFAILKVYAAIAIGQLFNVQKLLASFVSYFLLGFVPQIIMMIFLTITIPNVVHLEDFESNIGGFVNFTMFFGLAFEIVLSTIFFVITNYIFKNKLNLE